MEKLQKWVFVEIMDDSGRERAREKDKSDTTNLIILL